MTIFPSRGSRPVIFWMYGTILSSVRVTVAEIVQLASGMFSQNFSGRPNAGSWAARFFHSDQAPPRSVTMGAG
ncbi:hypothetical protein FHX72_002558 [Pseudoclavibacter helvolus]|uniref:Uncharacterized protein n=1 Tax=Pseudoclavibacter helvolus TaxID=255205 RepID=A0A7W4YFK6_9MICO|nr:hypothetical protein [Pseudoclavibacter helvolus]